MIFQTSSSARGFTLVEQMVALSCGLFVLAAVLTAGVALQQHYQGAAYIVYPLGFNNASIKLVLSRATYAVESDKDGDGVFQRDESAMTAGRVRFTLPF